MNQLVDVVGFAAVGGAKLLKKVLRPGQGGSGSESSEQTTAEFLDDLSKVVCLEDMVSTLQQYGISKVASRLEEEAKLYKEQAKLTVEQKVSIHTTVSLKSRRALAAQEDAHATDMGHFDNILTECNLKNEGLVWELLDQTEDFKKLELAYENMQCRVKSQREAHERAMEDSRTTLRHETLVMRRRFNTLKSESERCEAALKGVIAKLVCEKAAAEQQHLCQAAQLKGQVHDRKRALLRLAAEAADKDAVIAELLRQKVAGERRHECQVAHLQSLHKDEVESLKQEYDSRLHTQSLEVTSANSEVQELSKAHTEVGSALEKAVGAKRQLTGQLLRSNSSLQEADSKIKAYQGEAEALMKGNTEGIGYKKDLERATKALKKEQEKVQKYSNNADKLGKTVKALEKSDKASKERVRDLESEMHVMSARIPATRRAANHQSTSKPAKKKADQDAVTDAATPTAQAQGTNVQCQLDSASSASARVNSALVDSVAGLSNTAPPDTKPTATNAEGVEGSWTEVTSFRRSQSAKRQPVANARILSGSESMRSAGQG